MTKRTISILGILWLAATLAMAGKYDGVGDELGKGTEHHDDDRPHAVTPEPGTWTTGALGFTLMLGGWAYHLRRRK